MSKKTKNALEIFVEGIGLYFSNFQKFLKYMFFPVLGQLLGLILIGITTWIYVENLPKLLTKYPNLNDYKYLILLSILVTLPGLVIFLKAFWEYLIAYGAINSMYENMKKSGRVYDFTAHTELIKRRTPAFIGLWFLIGIFSLIAVCPLFWVICGIFAVYFVLIFQVFTFEPDKSPLGCFKKSFVYIKGHFAGTFLLLALTGSLTYILIPQIFVKMLSFVGFNKIISYPFISIFQFVSDFDLAKYGIENTTAENLALMLVELVVAQIIIQYTLPMRSIIWSLWYRENAQEKISLSTSKKSKLKPSEKLMQASKKKYSKKKIDSNILKRAMEKDDEE